MDLLAANHLDRRLPAGSCEEAAFAGLQDSGPRSAVLALHARVEGVGPEAWQDPRFVQVWGPRGAVYVVNRRDVGVFTLGTLPRDPKERDRLEGAAQDVLRVLEGGAKRKTEVLAALPHLGPGLLARSCATGLLRVRWDARDTLVRAAERPAMDPEEARVELARRCLRSVGAVTPAGLAWWVGVKPADAARTLQALAAPPAVRQDARPTRLLPPGDPYLLQPDRERLVPDAACRKRLWPASDVWPGAILWRGGLVGTWRRRLGRLTLHPWTGLDREEVEAEAATLARPLGVARVAVDWS